MVCLDWFVGCLTALHQLQKYLACNEMRGTICMADEKRGRIIHL